MRVRCHVTQGVHMRREIAYKVRKIEIVQSLKHVRPFERVARVGQNDPFDA